MFLQYKFPTTYELPKETTLCVVIMCSVHDIRETIDAGKIVSFYSTIKFPFSVVLHCT